MPRASRPLIASPRATTRTARPRWPASTANTQGEAHTVTAGGEDRAAHWQRTAAHRRERRGLAARPRASPSTPASPQRRLCAGRVGDQPAMVGLCRRAPRADQDHQHRRTAATSSSTSKVTTRCCTSIQARPPGGRDLVRQPDAQLQGARCAAAHRPPDHQHQLPHHGSQHRDGPDRTGNPNLNPELATASMWPGEVPAEGGGMLSVGAHRRINGLIRNSLALETVSWGRPALGGQAHQPGPRDHGRAGDRGQGRAGGALPNSLRSDDGLEHAGVAERLRSGQRRPRARQPPGSQQPGSSTSGPTTG